MNDADRRSLRKLQVGIDQISVDFRVVEARYNFGRNWLRYLDRLPANAREEARRGLEIHVGEIGGCSFLDVGCGSGLMSVAALDLGAEGVLAFDYDPISVETARSMLTRFAPGGPWTVRRGDILDDDFGTWDVVYAWGVLHHTGDVREALRRSTEFVADGGRLVVGIYKRTPLCRLWTLEKQWYSRARRWQQLVVRAIFLPLLLLAWTVKGTLVERLHARERGMAVLADADDWLGGYPYESLSLAEIEAEVVRLGFTVDTRFPIPDRGFILGMGWAGTGVQTVRFLRRDCGGQNREE